MIKVFRRTIGNVVLLFFVLSVQEQDWRSEEAKKVRSTDDHTLANRGKEECYLHLILAIRVSL